MGERSIEQKESPGKMQQLIRSQCEKTKGSWGDGKKEH